MKRLALVLLTAVTVLCFAASAFAGALAPGAKTSCKDAKSITLTASGTSSAGDRGNANAVIWKSANATTIPITLGPTDDNNFKSGAAGAKFSGIKSAFSKGRKSVTLNGQSNFSRGDSIGDISGEVRITNTGTIPINVSCN